MPTKANENLVTWKGVIWFVTLVAGIMAAGFGAAMTEHSCHPHTGTMTTQEFNRVYESLQHRLDRIDVKLDRIIERQ